MLRARNYLDKRDLTECTSADDLQLLEVTALELQLMQFFDERPDELDELLVWFVFGQRNYTGTGETGKSKRKNKIS